MNKLFDVLFKVLSGLLHGFVESRFRQECLAMDWQAARRESSSSLGPSGPPVVGIL